MPIEIRELSIKVNVNQDQNQQSAASGANSGEEKTTLIKEAVEQVLQIIANKKER